MNSKVLILFGAAAALCLSACNSGKSSSDAAGADSETEARKVSVVTTAKEDINHNSVYPSTVQANVVNNIASQTSGRIRKLNVEVGDFVSAGQVLAELDRVSLDQAAIQLKNNETEYNRVKALLEEGGISQSDYESIELSYKVSKSSYDNILENTILRAPVSGVVTARNYDKGDMYAISTPIYTVQQITPVKLLVGVSETDYTKVKAGDEVTLTVDAIPDRTFEGKIVRIYPVIDAASHTFNAEVQVKNADRTLRPGMYAKVSINLGKTHNVVVPDTAVIKQQGSGVRTAFVVDSEGKAEIRIVTLGSHFDGKYEILSGLEEGERVIVKGNSSLKAGDKVEVI